MARLLVVGAGMGGLAAALRLSAAGHDVTVLERAAAPGGKMRQVFPGARPVDAGPTVFTMRWVLEELFNEAGATLSDHLALRPVEVLARHAWPDGSRLDLFADPQRSFEAIARFAGPREAEGFRGFCERARRVYAALEGPFIRAPRPSPVGLAAGAGPGGLASLWRASPFATLWSALGEHFKDARLRQLFGRYSTYTGASPFEAPATLMLIAHVEQEGVWLVEGGMHRVAQAFQALAERRGARFRFGAEAASLLVDGKRCAGVRLASGEEVRADAVVFNGDAMALRDGLMGPEARRALRGAPGVRSLSALTWCVEAEAGGMPLVRHNVAFGGDYEGEFRSIFRGGKLPAEPTTYICAQDRDDAADAPPGPERLLILANAPAAGASLTREETERCRKASFDLMQRCGIRLRVLSEVETGPAEFARLFPGTEGALYGQATHGWRSSFSRPGSRTAMPGLYLAGGSVHPGAGVPMAAMSGRLAAARLLSDLASSTTRRATATRGGTWTRSATTGGTG